MRQIGVTLTEAEIATHKHGELRQLVRAAEVCSWCHGIGIRSCPKWTLPCEFCNGTGYTPDPIGEAGDALFHQEEWRTLTKPIASMIPDGDDGHPGYAVLVQYRAAGEPDQDGNDRFWCECPASFKDAPADANVNVGKSGFWQPAETMPEWASRRRITRTDDPRFVRLWEAPKFAPVPDPDRAPPLIHFLHDVTVNDWDRNNPDNPWSSNPWAVVGGVK